MTPMKRRGFLALGSLAAGSLAAPRLVSAQSLRTIADTLAGDTRFSRLLDIATQGTAVDEFRQAAPTTLFAPVDQAFFGAPANLLQDMLGGNNAGQTGSNVRREELLALIRYHIVPGAFAPEQLMGGDRRVRTLNGGDLQISGTGTGLTLRNPSPASSLTGSRSGGLNVPFGAAEVLGSPVLASNGVIYPISQVLFP